MDDWHEPDLADPRPPAWSPRTRPQPMTPGQARYLKVLALKRGQTFDPTMDRRQASVRINELKRPRRYAKGSRAAALKVRCPKCGAKPNQPCKKRDGTPRKSCHFQRHDARSAQSLPK